MAVETLTWHTSKVLTGLRKYPVLEVMRSPVWLASVCRPSQERPDSLVTQLYLDLVKAVQDGRIGDGDRLPSSRSAARALGVSRSTITAAYDLLTAEGVIVARQGAAPRVTAPTVPIQEKMPEEGPGLSRRGAVLGVNHRRAALAEVSGALMPGEPDEGLFPAEEWARLLRRVSGRPLGSASQYDSVYGTEELRVALQDRLVADRGVHVGSDQIIVVPGTQAALALLAHALADPDDLVALEDPGWLGARTAFLGAGLRVAPLQVDCDGADPETLPFDARMAYLTPSNQYPLGRRLTFTRRLDFIARAKATGAILIEDDYDSDFHWSGRTIPALAAQAHSGHVVLVGSASKVLLPALRIGWIVVPHSMIDALRVVQRNLGLVANVHAQLALAELMRSGRYRTQVRRIARTYRERVGHLLEALKDVPGIHIEKPDGGVQVTLQFLKGWNEEQVIKNLRTRGLTPGRLSAYCRDREMRGLVIGLGDATQEHVETLRQCLIGSHERRL